MARNGNKTKFSKREKRAYWIGYGSGLSSEKNDHAAINMNDSLVKSYANGKKRAQADTNADVARRLNGKKK